MILSLPQEAQDQPELRALAAHISFTEAQQSAPPLAALHATLARNAEDLNAYYQLSAVLLFNDDYAGALNALLEIIKRDAGDWGTLARKGMLAIFHILGNDNEVTKRFRTLLLELKT